MGQGGDPGGAVIDESRMSSDSLPATPREGRFRRLLRLTLDTHHGRDQQTPPPEVDDARTGIRAKRNEAGLPEVAQSLYINRVNSTSWRAAFETVAGAWPSPPRATIHLTQPD